MVKRAVMSIKQFNNQSNLSNFVRILYPSYRQKLICEIIRKKIESVWDFFLNTISGNNIFKLCSVWSKDLWKMFKKKNFTLHFFCCNFLLMKKIFPYSADLLLFLKFFFNLLLLFFLILKFGDHYIILVKYIDHITFK